MLKKAYLFVVNHMVAIVRFMALALVDNSRWWKEVEGVSPPCEN